MADAVFNQYFLTGIDQGIFPPPVGQGEEAPGVKGTWDTIGLNYYYRIRISEDFLTKRAEYGEPPPGAELSSMGWEVYPEGFYHMIKRLAQYGPPIYITENGFPTDDDDARCSYVLRHLLADAPGHLRGSGRARLPALELHRQLRVGGGMGPQAGHYRHGAGHSEPKAAALRLPLPRHRPRQRDHGQQLERYVG